jgi:CRISPR system Cascade subunit CasB
MTRPFTAGDPTIAALLGWWHGLEQRRGHRAELRRCSDLMQVMQTEAFHAARSRLIAGGLPLSDSRNPRLAAITALAAHVRALSDASLAESFSSGDKAAVSPLRFRQILEAGDDDELFTRLRRVLPLINGRVNLAAMAGNVWYWGDAVRKRWVYDYNWPVERND